MDQEDPLTLSGVVGKCTHETCFLSETNLKELLREFLARSLCFHPNDLVSYVLWFPCVCTNTFFEKVVGGLLDKKN